IGPFIIEVNQIFIDSRGDTKVFQQRVDRLLKDKKIGPNLALLIQNTVNETPQSPYRYQMILMSIAEALSMEIAGVSAEFPDFMNDLVDRAIDEVVNSIYDDTAARDHWRNKLKEDILPSRVENLMPEQFFGIGLFKDKKDMLLSTIFQMNKAFSGSVTGLYDPEIRKICVTSSRNELRFLSTLIHEMIHYLADHDQIKIDPSYEYATHAIATCTRIMHARSGDIRSAEENIEIFQEGYVPGCRELYSRGKEMTEKGESAYILRPSETGKKAAYFSTELLIIEAIKIYEKAGIPSLRLRRYLANKNKKLETPFEQEEFHWDEYFAQETAGIIMAGILMAEHQKTKKHPIRILVDYFAELDDVLGAPTGGDKEWFDGELLPELEMLGQQLFGKRMKLISSDVTDRLGLWWGEIGQWDATIKYWPFTIYPRDKKNKDRTTARKEAKERAIGNLLLALYRLQYAKDEEVEKAHQDKFGLPAFKILWDALLIPRAVHIAVPAMQKRIKSNKSFEGYDRMPGLIQKVFDEKFNLGKERVERELFNSYPLHLKYLDSILYRWSQYDLQKHGKNLPADNRVAKDSIVATAIKNTSSGWIKIMFEAGEFKNYEEIYNVIITEIWDEYKKLFDKDVEIEKNKQMIQKLEEEGAIQPGKFDPANLTPDQEKELEDLFNSLPQSVQEAIREQIENMMNSASQGTSGGKQQGKPQQGKSQGMPQPGKPSKSQGGEGNQTIENVKNSLESLSKTIDGLENLLNQMSEDTENIGTDAGNIGKGVPAAGEASKDQRKPAPGDIDKEAGALQDKASELAREGKTLQNGAEGIKDETFGQESSMPAPGVGKKARGKAADFGENADEVNDKIKELQSRVNELKKLTQRLKDIDKRGGDSSQISEVAEAIRDEVGKIRNSSKSVQDSLGKTEASLGELQKAVEDLSREVSEIGEKNKKGPDQKGKDKNAGQAGGKTGKPEDTGKEGAPQEGKETPAEQTGQSGAEQTGQAGETGQPGQSGETGQPGQVGEAGRAEEADKPEQSETTDQAGPDVDTSLQAPESKDLTSLKSVIESAQNQPVSELKDEYAGKGFKTKVDPEWLEALKKKELFDEMQRTGLNEKELKEYKDWLNLLDPELVESMKEVVKALVLPAEDVEKSFHRFSGLLKKPIKTFLGGSGFVKKKVIMPTPVKLTLLFDKSGSMSVNNRILYAKLTLLLLLEVIFDVNSELESKRWPPIEFEVGFFDENSEPFISHETSSRIGEDRKERLIYNAITHLVANNGTDDAKALGEFVTRLKESPEPMGSEEKAKRILMLIGDGNVDESDKSEIRGVLEYAKEEDVEVFGVSVGDEKAQRTVLNAFGEERAILPQRSDLGDIPLLVIKKFAECIAPPNAEISWEQVSARLASIVLPILAIPLLGDLVRFALHNTYFKEVTHTAQAEEPPLRATGYRHFFYQEKGGKDYLVFQRTDKNGKLQKIRWQRGAGGANVPDKVTIDDDDNEFLIREILETLYLPDVEYTSYSSDGKFYLSQIEDKLILNRKSGTGTWQVKGEFNMSKNPPEGKVGGEYKVFESGSVKWRLDGLGNLYVLTGESDWRVVISGIGNFSENIDIKYDAEAKGYIVADLSKKRVVMAKIGDLQNQLTVDYDLQIETFKKDEDWEGKIVRLIGETGLGKDELVRAAAHLMNEEVYFVAGNKDMEPEDLFEYQTLGVKEELATGHLYTTVNNTLHYGGWVVVDEINKVKSKVLNTLKTSIAAKTHQRWVKVNGKEEQRTLQNHPRARILGTLNTVRDNIAQSKPPDQASQDRLADIEFVWRDPNSEKNLQYELAIRKLRKIKPLLTKSEFDEQAKVIRDAVDVLVDISWPMRLTFMGYDATQQAELVKDDFKNWKKLLKDPTFAPKSKPGKNLRRAPSPRTIANIIEHSIMFQKTWQHAPLMVSSFWYNFWVDDLKPRERDLLQRTITNLFTNPAQKAGASGIKDEDDLVPVKLSEKSFSLEGNYLIVTPEKINTEGKDVDYWDAIKIELHPDAVKAFKTKGLPEDIRYWLSTGDEYNSRQLYFALQMRALGKSLLAGAIAELLSGPDFPQAEIKPETDKEDITFKPYSRGGV
ncbi:MAG: AAA family ATPase, partial [Candidatus Omnitrophica bacterium]|nr:AAA family ATPase [Candidatus Omnitrophota bacterium]